MQARSARSRGRWPRPSRTGSSATSSRVAAASRTSRGRWACAKSCARLATLVDVVVARWRCTTRPRRVRVVMGGLGLRPDDEIVTTADEHFGLLGALAPLTRTGRRRRARARAILAAVTPRTRLLAPSQVLWTTGRYSAGAELRERRACRSSRRCAIGRGGPRDGHRDRLPHHLRPEVAVRPGRHRCARRLRSGAARLPPDLLFGRTSTSRTAPSRLRPGGRRFDAGWWSP